MYVISCSLSTVRLRRFAQQPDPSSKMDIIKQYGSFNPFIAGTTFQIKRKEPTKTFMMISN